MPVHSLTEGKQDEGRGRRRTRRTGRQCAGAAQRATGVAPRSPWSRKALVSQELCRVPHAPSGFSTEGRGGRALPAGKAYAVATTSHSCIFKNLSSHSALDCGSQATSVPLPPFPSGLPLSLIIEKGGWQPCLIIDFRQARGSATGEHAGGESPGFPVAQTEREAPGRSEEGRSPSPWGGPSPHAPPQNHPTPGNSAGRWNALF